MKFHLYIYRRFEPNRIGIPSTIYKRFCATCTFISQCISKMLRPIFISASPIIHKIPMFHVIYFDAFYVGYSSIYNTQNYNKCYRFQGSNSSTIPVSNMLKEFDSLYITSRENIRKQKDLKFFIQITLYQLLYYSHYLRIISLQTHKKWEEEEFPIITTEMYKCVWLPNNS